MARTIDKIDVNSVGTIVLHRHGISILAANGRSLDFLCVPFSFLKCAGSHLG